MFCCFTFVFLSCMHDMLLNGGCPVDVREGVGVTTAEH